jgi:hypothetical protein
MIHIMWKTLLGQGVAEDRRTAAEAIERVGYD